MSLSRHIVSEFTGVQEVKQDYIQEVMGMSDVATKSLSRVNGKLLHTTGTTSSVWSLTQLFFRAGTVLVSHFGPNLAKLKYLKPFSGLLFPYPVFPRFPKEFYTDDYIWLDLDPMEPNGVQDDVIDDNTDAGVVRTQKINNRVDLSWEDFDGGQFSYEPATGYIYPASSVLVGRIVTNLAVPSKQLQIADSNLLLASPSAPSEVVYDLETEAEGRAHYDGMLPTTKVYVTELKWNIKLANVLRTGQASPSYPPVPPYQNGNNNCNFCLFAAQAGAGVGYQVNNAEFFGSQPYYAVPVNSGRATKDQAADAVHGSVWIWGGDHGTPSPSANLELRITMEDTVYKTEGTPFTVDLWDTVKNAPVRNVEFEGGFELFLDKPEVTCTFAKGNTLPSDAFVSGAYFDTLTITRTVIDPEPVVLTCSSVGTSKIFGIKEFDVTLGWTFTLSVPPIRSYEIHRASVFVKNRHGVAVDLPTEPKDDNSINGQVFISIGQYPYPSNISLDNVYFYALAWGSEAPPVSPDDNTYPMLAIGQPKEPGTSAKLDFGNIKEQNAKQGHSVGDYYAPFTAYGLPDTYNHTLPPFLPNQPSPSCTLAARFSVRIVVHNVIYDSYIDTTYTYRKGLMGWLIWSTSYQTRPKFGAAGSGTIYAKQDQFGVTVEPCIYKYDWGTVDWALSPVGTEVGWIYNHSYDVAVNGLYDGALSWWGYKEPVWPASNPEARVVVYSVTELPEPPKKDPWTPVCYNWVIKPQQIGAFTATVTARRGGFVNSTSIDQWYHPSHY